MFSPNCLCHETLAYHHLLAHRSQFKLGLSSYQEKVNMVFFFLLVSINLSIYKHWFPHAKAFLLNMSSVPNDG